MAAVSGYHNPVIPGFHPDPSVCRVGNEYFLVTSSFTYFPGVPIFRSTDLVHWTQIGNVLERSSQLDLSATRAWSSMGVYAPTIRYRAGRYWMITTNVTANGTDNFYVTATDPAGPWSDPVHVAVDGIDPDLAWDDDGNCWVHVSSRGRIMRCRIDDRTGVLLDPAVPTWSGTGMQYPEAPHLLRRNGIWYLLIAEGGTERGHAVSIARAPSPMGPWQPCPANPILSHRSTNRPIQNTGHSDLVEAVDGSWWMVCLGVRLRGVTPGFHVLGRETFLVPIEWDREWPVAGNLELTMPNAPPGGAVLPVPSIRDDFDRAALGPHWVSVRVPHPDRVSLTDRSGWLTLHGSDNGLDDPLPVFVGRRQQHHHCRVRVRVDPGTASEAGVALRMDEHAHYEIFVRDGALQVRARIGPLSHIIATAPMWSSVPVMRIETKKGSLEPDRIQLGYDSETGAFEVLADLDGRYLSTEVTGGFIGRVIGVYAVGETAAIDWFDYEPLAD